jgi:heparinase II/III-like protein
VRLSRLRQMPLTEIAYRGKQEASKWLDRAAPVRSPRDPRRLLREQAPALADGRRALEFIQQTMPARFFPGLASADSAELLTERLPDARHSVLAAAEQVRSHRFDLLGYHGLQLGEPIDWRRDPIADRQAPMVHWSRINPLDARVVGDSKVIWELNRHQWLVTLGQAYWLTGDRRYAKEASALLRSWIRANPYGVGINWTSSLEAALRLIAWSWALMLLRDADAIAPDDAADVFALVWLHASHIERYLSYYFSPNTHLTGEALGLFYAGVLFPEFRDATRWRDVGRRILIGESRRQILTDGVYVEHATCYHRYTLEIYLHFLILASRNGIAVPDLVRERVERMLDFSVAVNRPDRTMPAIGDADGGWLLPL